jgi:DNA mismatch repair protein MutL
METDRQEKLALSLLRLTLFPYNNIMSIEILPPEVASQIAAGEVVERPASVVKELIENALDAEASSISISIENAGQGLIEVADNGCGISAEELSIAVERHATSKLHLANDLFHITTLGFRGEALASIGSISRLTLVSRMQDAGQGAQLQVEGGITQTLHPVGAPVGTQVRVEHLFYNVPARLKFLKSEATERRLIDNLVTRYALAYPQVRFRLHQEGRISLQTSGKGQQREILATLYGAEVARQMLEVIYEDDPLRIRGFISPTSLTRANRREISFFVNGRPIQDASLSAALLKGYHTLLMVGRYPLAILFLEVPPESVDVNVHPTKAEVRFGEPNRIFTGLQSAVRRALLANNPVPGLDGQIRWAAPTTWAAGQRQVDPAWNWREAATTGPNAEQFQSDGSPSILLPGYPSQSSISTQRIPLLRLVGQIANTYLVAEGPDGLYLIDQHAAHERVLFERFMAQHGERIPSQTLLQPVVVDLSPANSRLIADQLTFLAELGFHLEAFGPNSFLVRAIPALIASSDPASALSALVDEFEEDETPLLSEQEARIIARVCKRAAIKSGQSLSPEEQKGLLTDLEACQSPRTCPHGRPTMIHLSVDLLERQFGRKGAR